VQHLRGRIEAFQAPWAAVSTVLVPEAERIEPLDPARAARMFMDAALALPDDRTRSREFLRRARAAAKRAGETLAPGVKLVLAENLRSEWIMGRAYRAPGPRQWEALLALADDLSFADDLLEVAGKASYEGTHYARAFELTRRVADAAREASALGVLATALTALVWLEYRTSEWTAAFAHATEALRLTEDTGRHVHLAALLFMLGRLEAVRGNEAQCRDHVSRAVELAGSLELEEHSRWQAGVALGLLELGLGRPEEAVGLLEPAVCAGDGSLLAGIARGHGDLIEAYIRTGNRPRAEETLAEWERRARVAERPWALAVAARCRGLLADDDRLDEHFGQALAWHAEVPTPFERARTELSYGERLRRGRRRVEARDQLRSALATFEELGAHPWAERARAELAASGARAKPRDGSAIEELTPQELQVALVVAGGATNREAAAALFVSPKTVEAHLGSIYRKLGLRSRTELASRFARGSRRRRRNPAHARSAAESSATSCGSASPSAANASAKRQRVRSGSSISFAIARTSTAGTPASSAARRTAKPSIASTSVPRVPPTRPLVPIGRTHAAGRTRRARARSSASAATRLTTGTAAPMSQ